MVNGSSGSHRSLGGHHLIVLFGQRRRKTKAVEHKEGSRGETKVGTGGSGGFCSIITGGCFGSLLVFSSFRFEQELGRKEAGIRQIKGKSYDGGLNGGSKEQRWGCFPSWSRRK
ncbi:unnamed protein product [Lactuca virosa]|uniref:Uncharacterized protein n=1 Tax=Lactuca virosa TaxID=75947 RepID=A0AAU9NKG7_9ASTR|nr:unnamed protein product [Lactuca virosa]